VSLLAVAKETLATVKKSVLVCDYKINSFLVSLN